MHSIEKSVQTGNVRVFLCRREETPLQDLRPQMNFEQRKVFKRADVKVEEFILDQIGSLGIELHQKRLENCYLRNLIDSPELFSLNRNRLACHFDHRTGLLACYLRQRHTFGDFRRLVRNIYANQPRYVAATGRAAGRDSALLSLGCCAAKILKNGKEFKSGFGVFSQT